MWLCQVKLAVGFPPLSCDGTDKVESLSVAFLSNKLQLRGQPSHILTTTRSSDPLIHYCKDLWWNTGDAFSRVQLCKWSSRETFHLHVCYYRQVCYYCLFTKPHHICLLQANHWTFFPRLLISLKPCELLSPKPCLYCHDGYKRKLTVGTGWLTFEWQCHVAEERRGLYLNIQGQD